MPDAARLVRLSTIPRMWASTASSIEIDCLSCSRVTIPLPATTRTPSTEVLRMAASVTGSSGAVSTRTMSNRCRSWPRSSTMASDPSSSLGFGGIWPEARTCRFSSP